MFKDVELNVSNFNLFCHLFVHSYILYKTGNDDLSDEMDEYEDIDDKFDYDSDPSYTDHVYSSNMIPPGNGNSRYLGRNAHRVTSQDQLRNTEGRLITSTESEGEPSKPSLNE